MSLGKQINVHYWSLLNFLINGKKIFSYLKGHKQILIFIMMVKIYGYLLIYLKI